MIFVDNMRFPFGRMKMCHMWTNENVAELHEFASKIGLRRRWFQDDPRLPHYDVCLSIRKKAIELGAIEVSARDMVKFMKK